MVLDIMFIVILAIATKIIYDLKSQYNARAYELAEKLHEVLTKK